MSKAYLVFQDPDWRKTTVVWSEDELSEIDEPEDMLCIPLDRVLDEVLKGGFNPREAADTVMATLRSIEETKEFGQFNEEYKAIGRHPELAKLYVALKQFFGDRSVLVLWGDEWNKKYPPGNDNALDYEGMNDDNLKEIIVVADDEDKPEPPNPIEGAFDLSIIEGEICYSWWPYPTYTLIKGLVNIMNHIKKYHS